MVAAYSRRRLGGGGRLPRWSVRRWSSASRDRGRVVAVSVVARLPSLPPSEQAAMSRQGAGEGGEASHRLQLRVLHCDRCGRGGVVAHEREVGHQAAAAGAFDDALEQERGDVLPADALLAAARRAPPR